MLTPLHHTTGVHQGQFSLLEALLEEPFPRTPEDLLGVCSEYVCFFPKSIYIYK